MAHDVVRRLFHQRWVVEPAALLASTFKWAFLGGVCGAVVGGATRFFLWSLTATTQWAKSFESNYFSYYLFLPLTIPLAVWLIRTFAADAKGHGTEAVIAAIHTRSGRINWKVVPVKLVATLLTIGFGGSAGKEGPCAQIGAGITSLFADMLHLSNEDRRRLVICGVSAGFASVFGTPVSGALFGVEVLYLGRIEYVVLLPSLVAGIIAHLICNVTPPVAILHHDLGSVSQFELTLLSLCFGVLFGLIALMLIELMRHIRVFIHTHAKTPYHAAFYGGLSLVALYAVMGSEYSGLGVDTIDQALRGSLSLFFFAFFIKALATCITLECGGSGGILTPIFFIGATAGAAIAHLFGFPPSVFAAFGFVSVLAASANTPIAAAVMGMEILPGQIGVYAALAASTAYLIVGHHSVYPSQKLGFSKSSSLEIPLDKTIGDIPENEVHFAHDSLVERFRRHRARHQEEESRKQQIPPPSKL